MCHYALLQLMYNSGIRSKQQYLGDPLDKLGLAVQQNMM